MKKTSNILWGLVLIVIGLVIGLNKLEITNINLLFDGWWTLFLIIPCFIDLFKDENKTGDIIGVIVGILLLLSCQDILDFEIIWKLMLPIILIIIGLSLMFKDILSKKAKELKNLTKKNKNSELEYCSTFSGQNIDFDNEEFKGCELTAVFGGIKCDLRNAKINEDVIINTSAIFGGIDIRVPKDINVKIKQTSIFGGVSNSRKKQDNAKHTIYINATCLFGGVEIK